MTPNEKLVLFMKKKSEKLDEIKNGLGQRYFNKKDEDNIMAWDVEKAARVWNEIKSVIFTYGDVCGLIEDTCPFCLYTFFYLDDDCRKCTYGKLHGICDADKFDTDYYHIINVMYNKQLYDNHLYTNEYYRKNINYIENKD